MCVRPQLRMQHRALGKAPSVNMSAVPKWLLLQINGVYQAGQEGGELFFFPPCVLSESPAISLALQMKMTGKLSSWEGRQDLVRGSPAGLNSGLGTACSG